MGGEMRLRACLALAILVGANVVIASNMGFKLNKTLTKTSNTTNTNWVSLPYEWIPLATSETVCSETAGTLSQVGKYNESTDTITAFSCGGQSTPFDIVPGEAIFVTPVTNNVSWIIAGSHNDTMTVTLKKTAGRTNTNWISVPYHSTALSSQDICNQVPAATEIGKYNESSDTFTTFVCGGFDTPFNLVVGEGIYIKVTTNNTQWTPLHY